MPEIEHDEGDGPVWAFEQIRGHGAYQLTVDVHKIHVVVMADLGADHCVGFWLTPTEARNMAVALLTAAKRPRKEAMEDA